MPSYQQNGSPNQAGSGTDKSYSLPTDVAYSSVVKGGPGLTALCNSHVKKDFKTSKENTEDACTGANTNFNGNPKQGITVNKDTSKGSNSTCKLSTKDKIYPSATKEVCPLVSLQGIDTRMTSKSAAWLPRKVSSLSLTGDDTNDKPTRKISSMSLCSQLSADDVDENVKRLCLESILEALGGLLIPTVCIK